VPFAEDRQFYPQIADEGNGVILEAEAKKAVSSWVRL